MAQRQLKSTDTDTWLYGFGDGSAGDGSINTSTDAPIDSACSGTSGTTSLTATNASFAAGQLILIHQTRGTGVGTWELNKIASYAAGTITLAHALTNTYTNSGASVAQVLVMKQYNDLTINNAQTLTAKAWDGTVGGIVAFFAKGTVTVTGNIVINGAIGNEGTAHGTYAGATVGGFSGGNSINTATNLSYTGEGTTGARIQGQATANGNGGGSGNAGNSNGGGGGNGATGGQGGNPGSGLGGNAVGNAGLTSMMLGGGGGGGNGYNGSGGIYMSSGSSGGGIILIIAKAISITGTLQVKGGNGTTRGHYDGGSGAGGSVLLKAQTATLGTNLITAIGGTGTVNGGTGRIHLDYFNSYTGTTTPTLDATQDPTLGLSTIYLKGRTKNRFSFTGISLG